MKKICLVFFAALISFSVFAVDNTSTKKERNLIKNGNLLYHNKQYADAEVQYRKAIEENPMSEVAQFNLASSLIRQMGSADPNNGNNPVNEAKSIMSNLSQTASNKTVKELSLYNLGNLAFNAQDYQQSIDFYKSALRVNPDNDLTRQNLRLAQLRLKEQQQNKDKNNDKKQNQDKQNQDNQDKDKQNQDKKDQDKQEQDNNQQQQPQEKKDDDKQRQQQNQNGISEQNAEQILKTLDNQEAVTRQRVNAQMKKEKQSSRNNSRHRW